MDALYNNNDILVLFLTNWIFTTMGIENKLDSLQ